MTIISAEALKKKSLDQITAAVTAMAGAGKSVDISTKVRSHGAASLPLPQTHPFSFLLTRNVGNLINSPLSFLSAQVDASILGGLQVMVGDRFMDLSVSSRVADLGKAVETAEL